MKKYFVKTPWWLKKIFPSYVWSISTKEKKLFLTFDDGPNALATPFVLDQLKRYNASASFFCIGKNVIAEPHIYKRIIDEGHAIGNHTHNHYNGWKTKDKIYLNDIREAGKYIDSNLFRPPYGRISNFQAKGLQSTLQNGKIKIIMWDVLSGDFDESISGEQCLQNVLLNAREGSIIVFHDSQKAFEKLQYFLPLILRYFEKEGYSFEKLKVF
ncbi:MAG: polysaccharide deacetylase family protein [Chitinophagaceae bacterium]